MKKTTFTGDVEGVGGWEKKRGTVGGLLIRKLVLLRNWAYSQKFRFERGQQFLAFVNFGLLLLIASDRLKSWGFPRWSVYAMIPMGFFGMWLFGWFVVEVVRGFQKDEEEALKRSPAWVKHRENFGKVDEILRVVRGLNVASGGVCSGVPGVEVQGDRKTDPLVVEERGA